VGLSPLGYVRLKKIWQREAYEVIHLHEPLTPSITWWALLQAHHWPGSAIVGTFHAYHERPNWFYRHGQPVFERLFTRLDSLIAVSRAAYEFAYQMFPGDYHLIPNGVDLKRFSRPANLASQSGSLAPHRPLTLLFVGRLDQRKGFAHLFEAFINLKAAYPYLRLQVVGPFTAQDSEPYQQQARARSVTGVEFVGYVSPETLPDFYHRADIFCAPALGFESFGVVLLEAMAAGLPVVASDIAGYRTLITNGQEGLLTPPGQPDALAAALRQLLDRPHLRQELGRRGELKASHYSWDCIVDKILDVYRDTIEQKTKARYAVLGPIETGPASACARPANVGSRG